MLFSILIPTLESRREQFQRLYKKLGRQITNASCTGEVEIVHFLDNEEHSIGHKRNRLIEQAQGRFIAFVDDDDDVSDDYVSLICQAIREHPDIDCIGIKGVITFTGKHPHTFVHSLQYRRYFKKNGIYYRPPLHINPIKRDIALKYRFEDINYSEDIDWAMRICRDRALQREYLVDEPIYFYYSRRPWWYQVFIDRTETTRQALGLQLANRIHMRRWLRNLLGNRRL